MTDLTLQDADEKFERVERFQSLKSGEYCVARVAVPEEAILETDTLLILSIDWVDNAPHTVTLRAHPRHYGKSVRIKQEVDGKTHTTIRDMHTHKFLIKDFMEIFEHQPDADKVRSQELEQAQGRIVALQNELIETQKDPAKMQAIIANGLAERQKNKPSTGDQLPAVIDYSAPAITSVNQAIASGLSEQSVKALQGQAEQLHAVATIQSTWITNKSAEINRALNAMAPYFEEKGAAALAHTEEMSRHVKKIIDGVASLSLFVGTDVSVSTIRSGPSAPPNEPLTIVQGKLIMIEELSVYADLAETTDHRALELFEALLATDLALVDQIFPAPRCVVCMASTRRDIAYADPWESVHRNAENKKVFLLVRDGENVHMVLSPIETHLGSSRLFPSRNEVDKIFTGWNGEQITFQSLQYTKALKGFEMQALHYKRLLILLCGLDHRLKLFGEFYEGPASFHFISETFQREHFHFIHDDDESMMLEGGERIEPVGHWLNRMNRYLTSGSRVLGLWKELTTDSGSSPGACRIDARYYGHPDIRIAFKSGRDICLTLPVMKASIAEESYNVKVTPKRFTGEDSSLTPYLVMDAVDPDLLSQYIHDRKSRVHQLKYIRLFKQALAQAKAERQEEAPAREFLRAMLLDGQVIDQDACDELMNQGIRLWRAANRGAPLPSVAADKASPEWSSVFSVMYLLANAATSQLARIEKFAQKLNVEPLRISVTGKGQLILYAAPPEAERDNRITPHAWAHRMVLRLGERAISAASKKWSRIPTLNAAEHVVKDYPAARHWQSIVTGFESPEQKIAVLAACESGVSLLQELKCSDGAFESLVQRYEVARAASITDKLVNDPGLSIPIGVFLHKGTRRVTLRVISIYSGNAAKFIAAMAPSPEARHAFKQIFISPYENKDINAESFDAYPTLESVCDSVRLKMIRKADSFNEKLVPVHPHNSLVTGDIAGDYNPVPSFNKMIQGIIDANKDSTVWLAGDLAPTGQKSLDALFGIEGAVARYQPGFIKKYTFFRGAMGNKSPYEEVLVASPQGASQPKLEFTNDYMSAGHSTWLLPEEFEAIKEKLDGSYLTSAELPEGMPVVSQEGTLGCWYRIYKPNTTK